MRQIFSYDHKCGGWPLTNNQSWMALNTVREDFKNLERIN